MKFTVEFFRTREPDGAQAVDDARRLGVTLDMPQRPESFRMKDGDGATLFACGLDDPRPSGA